MKLWYVMKLCDFLKRKKDLEWSPRYAVKSKMQTAKQYISEKITHVQDGTALDQNSMHQASTQGQGERRKYILAWMFIKYLWKDIHKNQNTDWPWEGITGLLGTKVDFFFTVYTPVLWELKKTTPPQKKNQENLHGKSVRKFRHVLVLYIHYHVQSSWWEFAM